MVCSCAAETVGDAEAALDKAYLGGYAIYVPSISLVEVRYLVDKGTFTQAEFQQIVDLVNDLPLC